MFVMYVLSDKMRLLCAMRAARWQISTRLVQAHAASLLPAPPLAPALAAAAIL
jgi:hypothetical protein